MSDAVIEAKLCSKAIGLTMLFAIAVSAWSCSQLFADQPAPEADARADTNAIIERVLFGSCIKQDQPMPIFETMVDESARLVIFLGDNIYADTADISVMRTKYRRLGENRNFVRLRQKFPILATWDDHDFGVNDGGADYPMRQASQAEFIRFWNLPATSPVRSREGVYDAQIYGPIGKRVQIILLDTRYFRSPLKRGERRVGGPYVPDESIEKTMLGPSQWVWLERQLRQPAEVRILATSIQFIAESAGQETWSNLPHERTRLIELIRRSGAGGVILISGDRHWSELSMLDQGTPYPLYELTSSSFNQRHPRGTPTENRFRADERTFHRENYGVLQFDWTAAQASVTMQVRDLEGDVRIEKRLSLKDLQAER